MYNEDTDQVEAFNSRPHKEVDMFTYIDVLCQ